MNQVNACVFTTHGDVLVTGSEDGALVLWDLAQFGDEIATVGLHNSQPIIAVDRIQGPPGHPSTVMVSCSRDGAVAVWDCRTTACSNVFASQYGEATCCAVMPARGVVVLGFACGIVAGFEVMTAVEVLRFRCNTMVTAVCCSADEGRLVCASDRGLAQLWSTEFGEPELMCDLKGHTGAILACDFSACGTYIATASQDGSAKLWLVDGGSLETTMAKHSRWVATCRFSPDSKLLATAGGGQRVWLWSVPSGKPLRVLCSQEWVHCLRFRASGDWLVCGGGQGRVAVYNVEGCLEGSDAHVNKVNWLTYSSNGGLVMSCSDDHTAKLWNTTAGELVHTLRGHLSAVLMGDFQPSGKECCTCSGDRTVRVWDVVAGTQRLVLSGHRAKITWVKYSPDGSLIASASDDMTTRIWHATDGDSLLVLPVHLASPGAAVWSADSQELLAGEVDGTVAMWDADSGERLEQLPQDGQVSALDLDSAASVAVTAVEFLPGEGSSLLLWDTNGEGVVAELPQRTGVVGKCRLLPGPRSHLAAFTDSEGALCVWDTSSGQSWELDSDPSVPLDFAFTGPDGSLIVACFGDGSVRLYDAELGRLLTLFSVGDEACTCCASAESGEFVACATLSGRVLLLRLT